MHSFIDAARLVCGKRVCVTVGCPSVRLSVPSIYSSSDVQLLCRNPDSGLQQLAGSVSAVIRGGSTQTGITCVCCLQEAAWNHLLNVRLWQNMRVPLTAEYGTIVRRYSWQARCRFPGLAVSNAKILYIYTHTYLHIYRTALGKCYGLKLPKCWLQFKKKNHCVILL